MIYDSENYFKKINTSLLNFKKMEFVNIFSNKNDGEVGYVIHYKIKIYNLACLLEIKIKLRFQKLNIFTISSIFVWLQAKDFFAHHINSNKSFYIPLYDEKSIIFDKVRTKKEELAVIKFENQLYKNILLDDDNCFFSKYEEYNESNVHNFIRKYKIKKVLEEI